MTASTTSSRPTSRRGKTRAQIELETRHREAEAVRLRAANMSYDEIARQLGWSNDSAARKAVQRALARHEEDNIDELRKVENAKLDLLEEYLWRILETTYYAHDRGRIVHDIELVENGTEVVPTLVKIEDPGPHISAIRELRQVSARRAALMGLDAPMRRIVDVITDDAVEAEIRRLEAMMEALDD